MKHLILLRHAKTNPTAPSMDDFDRTLTEKGLEDAKKAGEFLRQLNVTPDKVYCSSAARTKETIGSISVAFENPLEVEFSMGLYLANTTNILQKLQSSADYGSIMVVGHNPGIHDLALLLSGQGDEGSLREMQMSFPTSAMVLLEFDVENWTRVSEGAGRLKFFKPGKFEI